MSDTKKSNSTPAEADPITQAKYALQTYEHMKQSITFFTDMIDFHIKTTTKALQKMEAQEEQQLNKTP